MHIFQVLNNNKNKNQKTFDSKTAMRRERIGATTFVNLTDGK